jgi:hypothetical protein
MVTTPSTPITAIILSFFCLMESRDIYQNGWRVNFSSLSDTLNFVGFLVSADLHAILKQLQYEE